MAGTKQPADKSHFILPDLGEGVHEAELIRWRVKPGERVDEHQTLAEMETDKALVEVPSPWAGVVKELKGNEGDIINVGSVLVTYESTKGGAKTATEQTGGVKAAEQAEPKAKGAPSANGSDSQTAEREDAGTVVGSVGGTLTVSERFRRREHEHQAQTTAKKALATPAVRRIARELGVDIHTVPGSGRGGRVTAGDVENVAGGVEQKVRPSRPAVAPRQRPQPVTGDGIAERIPFRGVRRKIAEALRHSVSTTVHFTVVDEADVTTLDAKRREYARVLGAKLSFLPFIMSAACEALRRHPALNANVDDDKNEILIKSIINLGCAVDTDHGLMVPVIEQADTLSIVELSDEVAALAAACRDRSIPREKLTGGTFTISNVGSYGGMFATPIINYPEVAILAAGRMYEKVMTRNGMFYAGKSLPLSMSCDHRVVDGAEGARFLRTVVTLLEDPEQLVGAFD
jgi:pyruvate dehydrogenase E2 component (dihydrolipoamide acetyltransferase)